MEIDPVHRIEFRRLLPQVNLSRAMVLLLAILVSYSSNGYAIGPFQNSLKSKAQPSSDKSYFYGRLSLEKRVRLLSYALGLTDLNSNKEHNIRFRSGSGLTVIEVPASRFRISHTLLGASPRSPESNRSVFAPRDFHEPFEAKPGEAYYIGDYTAMTKVTGKTLLIVYNKINFSARVTGWRNNYEETTKEFRLNFKNFRDVPTHSIYREARTSEGQTGGEASGFDDEGSESLSPEEVVEALSGGESNSDKYGYLVVEYALASESAFPIEVEIDGAGPLRFAKGDRELLKIPPKDYPIRVHAPGLEDHEFTATVKGFGYSQILLESRGAGNSRSISLKATEDERVLYAAEVSATGTERRADGEEPRDEGIEGSQPPAAVRKVENTGPQSDPRSSGDKEFEKLLWGMLEELPIVPIDDDLSHPTFTSYEFNAPPIRVKGTQFGSNNGKRFGAFRFKTPDEDGRLLWAFQPTVNLTQWYMSLPDADWGAFTGFQRRTVNNVKTFVQDSAPGKVKPGQWHIIWFRFLNRKAADVPICLKYGSPASTREELFAAL